MIYYNQYMRAEVQSDILDYAWYYEDYIVLESFL